MNVPPKPRKIHTFTSCQGHVWPRFIAIFYALFLAGIGQIAADPLFPYQLVPVGEIPESIVISDFNKDGNQDFAVSNLSGDVSIVIGKGDGTFFPERRVDVGREPHSIGVGDFDTDGNRDLVVLTVRKGHYNLGPGEIVVLKGNGEGEFFPRPPIPIGDGPVALVVGDFDENGDEDLIVSLRGSSPEEETDFIQVFLGDGSGGFVLNSEFPTGSRPLSIAVGDFDSDDDLDFVTANLNTNDLSIFLGNGNGTFGSETRVPAGGGPRGIAIADFDTDGNQDIATTNLISDELLVFLGNGDGSFQETSRFEVEGGPFRIVANDYDGDGFPDLAVLNQCIDNRCYQGDVGIFLGLGDGTFVLSGRFRGPDECSWDLKVSDFDNDGARDFAIVDPCVYDVLILSGNGDGTFDSVPRFIEGDFLEFLAADDINLDRKKDLLVLSIRNDGRSNVSLHFGNREGRLGTPTQINVGLFASSLATGDFNSDRFPDFAVTERGPFPFEEPGRILVFLGDGGGTFQLETQLPVEGQPFGITVDDFNGDGEDDFAILDNWRVGIFLGHGDGTFGPETRFSAGEGPTSIGVGDFNLDGKKDLAVSSFRDPFGISILFGDGNGSFDSSIQFNLGFSSYSLVVGDFNLDHVKDLAVLGPVIEGRFHVANAVNVLLGTGDGFFELHSQMRVGERTFSTGSLSMDKGDLDSDGILDLVVGDPSSSAVSVFLGMGDGTFHPLLRFRTGSAPISTAVVDFNGDSRPDLATANLFTRDLVIHPNQNPEPVSLPFDFLPQECPNKLNQKKKGVLTFSLLGTPGFDLMALDFNSLNLFGIIPLRVKIEDVSSPFYPFVGKKNQSDCTEIGPDGLQDLILKFDSQSVIEAIKEVFGRELVDGEVIVLQLLGNLKGEFGNTPVRGEDVVIVKN